jgi:hypothetical protein
MTLLKRSNQSGKRGPRPLPFPTLFRPVASAWNKIISYWTDFHEISYLNVFRKAAEKIQISLKLDKYNKYRLCTFETISLSVFLIIKKCF